MRNWGKTQPWLSLLARLGLAGVFLVAGLLKVQDLESNKRAVIAYELMPVNVAEFIGLVQPFIEIAIGLFLLLGLATRVMAWLSAAAMVIFISGIASAWARGLNIDCGCFSKGGNLAPGETPNYLPSIMWDVFYLALALFLIIFPVSRFSLDGWLNPGKSKVDIEGEESDGAEEG